MNKVIRKLYVLYFTPTATHTDINNILAECWRDYKNYKGTVDTLFECRTNNEFPS